MSFATILKPLGIKTNKFSLKQMNVCGVLIMNKR
jgi:hypothetical protein